MSSVKLRPFCLGRNELDVFKSALYKDGWLWEYVQVLNRPGAPFNKTDQL